MKKIKKLLCSLLVLMAVFSALPTNLSPVITVEAATHSDTYPELYDNTIQKEVHIRQSKSGCVFSSVAMMIRRASIINKESKKIWIDATESFIREENNNKYGNFNWNITICLKNRTYKTYSKWYNCSFNRNGITLSEIKKMLDDHPEGVVYYLVRNKNNNSNDTVLGEHAVLLTHYEGDTLYCMDPALSGTGIIILTDAYYRNDTKYTGKSNPSQSDILFYARKLCWVSSGITYHWHHFSPVTGDCTCGLHSHKDAGYDSYGICKKPGCNEFGYNYYADDYLNKIKTVKKGTATPASGKSEFYVYKKPLTAHGRVTTKGGIFNLRTVDLAVKKAEIVAEITNHLGNQWYELRINELPNTPVYVSVNNVTKKWYSQVTITNTSSKYTTWSEDEPVVLQKPKGIDVCGIIKTENSNISMVTAAIFDREQLSSKLSAAEWKKLINQKKCSAEEVLTYASNIPSKYKAYVRNINSPFDISEWNKRLLFSQLPNNKNYVYIITATDTNGVNKSVVYELKIGSPSSAKKKNDVILDNKGTTKVESVINGLSLLLPIVYSPGEELVGWTQSTDRSTTTAEYKAGEEFTPEHDTRLYAVFKPIEPPTKPILIAASYDIPQGESQLISWNKADGADNYKVYAYDSNNTKTYEQSSNGTSALIPFEKEGTYTVKVEAFNKSEKGSSGESEQAITVRVHGPSTVTFRDYNGNAWSTQNVPYGGTATTPTIPSRKGYLFSHWEGTMTNITQDTTLNAVYTPEKYKVTFYDANGDVLSDQYVSYNGDQPGSAIEPTAPAKENYTFTGWDTGEWQNVTKSGIKVHPVYVWSNEDVPLVAEIPQVIQDGNGYWVYYNVINYANKPITGRVVIAGKTLQGKFITQTESGAFFIDGEKTGLYAGNAYVPIDSADMSTLATFEVYVVDNYVTKKPIAQPASYIIGSIDGEYSAWMTEDELAAFTAPYTTVETKTQYSKRNKETVTTTSSTYLDWTLEGANTRYSDWGNWSAWQDAAMTSSDLVDVKTQQVQVKAAYTEYRYGRYKSTNCSKGTWYHFNDKSGKSSYGGTWYTDYTSWSTTRRSVTDSNYGYATTNNTIGTGRYNSSNNRYYWDRYVISGVNYWWEESRTISATYKTQYAYRTRSLVTDYTFSHWTNWTSWSDTVATASSTQEVQTRTMYRVKLSNSSQGDTYRFSGEVGASAANKQAILTVYKVDEASDYSNQYIEQVKLGENGAYDFRFDTLEVPSVQTGDYTVALTIEGSTESLYIGTIVAPKPVYTVQFVDPITGESINVQQVEEGSSATAPEAPEHDGYYFLGWEYGLGNIREDMRINARYVEKEYVVVFVDNVRSSVVMKKGIHYGMPVEAPEVESPEGYNFRGWITEDGKSIDAVTDHMVVIADYENITNTVTFLSADGQTLVQQTVNYGEFADNPLKFYANDDEELDVTIATGGSEDVTIINEENLNIPEDMYFVGWSEGAEDPVTQSLTITPMLSYFEDVPKVIPSVEGGIYIGQQTITLSTEDTDVSPTVQYRLITSDGTEGEWIEYDLTAAPEIAITQTAVLEIQGEESGKNTYTASYEYVILTESDLPAAPNNVTAVQNDSESISVNWNAVNGADGYIVNVKNDCDEISVYDVGNALSYEDYGVDELQTYSYRIAAYKNIEKDGAAFQAEGSNSEEASVFFSGENTLVSSVQISGPETVYESSAIQLEASVTPEDAYDSVVSWSTEEGTGDGYITADGMFYGLSAGTVTVKATAMDGSDVSATKVITVQQIDIADATLTVSSGTVRAGGTANVSVSISENSHAEAVQFAVLYDSSKLTLTSYTAGDVMKNLAPTISNPKEGVVLLNWESLNGLTAGGSLLELTFDVSADAAGPAIIEVPVNDSEYDFVFAKGNDMSQINVAAVNGTLNITTLMYGDVNGDEKVNVIDANLVRRYSAKLIELEESQMIAADVSGDGKVNVIDANLIRRYSAKLITSFPVENNN